jgi:hypothetical protein
MATDHDYDYDYGHGNPGALGSEDSMDQPGYGPEEGDSYEPHDMSQNGERFLTGHDDLRELRSIKSQIHTHLAHYDEADNRRGS